MSRYHWLSLNLVLALHEDQLSEHGGAVGVRDMALLETALAKPQQLASYAEPVADVAALAAAYTYGLAHLHPFTDGNKRTSLVVAETFIELHAHELDASDSECYTTWMAMAAGEMMEHELAAWLRERLRK